MADAVPAVSVSHALGGTMADAAPFFTVEVPPQNLIHAEILSVTSAMRKNQRWASAAAAAASTYAAMPFRSSSSSSSAGVAVGDGLFRREGETLKGHSGRQEDQPPSLLGNFMVLKMRLREMDESTPIDAVSLLHPFLDVVRSPETSGPITATALSSIDKFLTYGILSPSSPNLALAMAQLSSAGTHCKFEASDSVSDEVVLLKILEVLRNALTGRLGGVLSDESVCEMMETGLSMCCQMRLSEMLRRSAERTMQSMVAAVFSRLRSLPSEDDSLAASHPMASTVSLNELVEEQKDKEGGPSVKAPDWRSGAIPAASASAGAAEKEPLLAGQEERVEPTDAGAGVDHPPPTADQIEPYGLASLQELLRVLISLLNPHDQQHTDSMRLMALGLLNIAFEVGGRSMARFPTLRAMVADHLCKHLFQSWTTDVDELYRGAQLARSDHPLLLSHSLRVITNIFSTLRPYLKLQQELFLSFLLDRLILPPPSSSGAAPNKAEVENALDRSTWAADSSPAPETSGGRPGTPGSLNGRDRERERYGGGEIRELMLELLGHYARGKYTMVDLWVNYDCNVEGEDVLERLIKFLSRGVYPSHPTANGPGGLNPYQHQPPQESSQLMCLDTILEMMQHMAQRMDETPSTSLPPSFATSVTSSKASKRLLLEGATAFNLKPKVGLQFLEEHGLIYAEQPPIPKHESLAHYFRTAPKLDKRVLGDFISRPDQVDTLRAFMQQIDFKGKIICDAMRELLEGFRLPGESQQIARITEVFAEVYFATEPVGIKSQDAVYVLSYSVIMLNTDQHNPQVQKRMDLEAYSRNLRGVNDGENFDPDYLRDIYESIRKREIVLPEEHQSSVGFEYGWKELLRRARRSGLYTHNPTNAFDRGMFAVSWKPIVSAMSYAFANFQDDHMVQRAIGGFNHCASLAARFGMPEVFDYLILSLSRVSGLVQPASASSEVGNFPVVDVEGQKVTLSPLAVHFGENVKAQLAAVVLFTIANSNGAFIRQGWRQIFEIFQTLFVHSLLPPSMLMLEDFLSGESAIPLKPKTVATPREERRGDGGLLSTLSSYLLSPYGAGGDMGGSNFNDDDVEQTLSTVDTIASCRVDELYSHIFDLKGESLVAPLQVLVDLVQRLTIERIRTKTGSGSVPNSPQISITQSRVQLPYDPAAVLLLEIATSIVVRSKDSLAELWPSTFDFLSKLLASSNSFSSLFNERVVASLLRHVAEVIKVDELRDSTFLALDMLRSLSPAVLSSVAEPLMAGLSKVFLENAGRVHSATEWNLLFSLFSATAQQEAAAKISMDLLRQLAAGQLGAGLHHENYAAFLQTLAGFAYVSLPAGGKTVPERANDDAAMVRGQQIVDVLREVQASIPGLISTSTLSPARAWDSAWVPLLSAYAQLCLNPSRELRQNAISSLQRTLLAPEIIQNTDVDLTVIFERVFFPLLEELLKPQVFRRDPDGMGETRLRASALLCKVFLQYLTQLSERQGMQTMTELWLKILGYQDRFMHSGRRDQMARFLIPPYAERSEEQARLWDATFERIQPFLPELQRELFPPPRVPVPFSAEAPSPAHPHPQQRFDRFDPPPPVPPTYPSSAPLPPSHLEEGDAPRPQMPPSQPSSASLSAQATVDIGL
ncbi:GDP/GTP exchange factor for ARF [Rhodosporidiobolus nylandii]